MKLLHLTENTAIFNKPSGLLVHRGWDNDPVVAMTLARDALCRYVYPVHRLDRATSGALAFALTAEAARDLGDAFAAQQVGKGYLALVRGIPPERGTIDNPVPRQPRGERVDAVTDFERIAVFGRYALVVARPRTGRLHQIRRHLKHISCPLIGDVRYGKGEHNRKFRSEFDLHRLALHCFELSLPGPIVGESAQKLCVRAPLPDDLAQPLARMGLLDAALAAIGESPG